MIIYSTMIRPNEHNQQNNRSFASAGCEERFRDRERRVGSVDDVVSR
jgi:hypothetical protein